MTTITIDRTLLVRMEKELFLARNYGGILRDEPLLNEVSAALSAPATAPDELERKPMTDADIEAAARRSGATAYTNRFVNGSAFSFGPDALRGFVRAVESFPGIKEDKP